MGALRTLIFVMFGTIAALASSAAYAQVTEIYKCIDPQSGRPLYTSDKRETAGKKCELVSREVNVVPAQKAAARPSPPGFPKESAADRAVAKSKQRETLERELNQEQGMLADAKRKLAEQEAIRSGDEKNYARVLERLRPYQDAVEVHEKNVDALKRELGNLSR